MFFKRGQAGGAAGTIFIVTLLLILYILFIPSDARDDLIGEVDYGDSDSDDESNEETGVTLFRESPGLIERISDEDKKIFLNSFRIKALSGAQLIYSQNMIEVTNSVFTDISENITFETNPSLTDDLTLSFRVNQAVGSLNIKVNDETIFRGPAPTGDISPLNIPNRILERENEISFAVSSPGIAFWRVHRYNLEGLKIVGNVVDLDENSARQSFNIRPSDYDSLESATLRFLPMCNEVSRDLRIYLNGNSIFSGSPDCDIFNRISVSKNMLNPRINYLEFELGRGDILVDETEINLEFSETSLPVYYFDLDDDDFYDNETLRSGSVNLALRFASRDDVSIRVFVNGRVFGLTSDGTDYERDITEFVLPGVNSVEIAPLESISISEVRASRVR